MHHGLKGDRGQDVCDATGNEIEVSAEEAAAALELLALAEAEAAAEEAAIVDEARPEGDLPTAIR